MNNYCPKCANMITNSKCCNNCGYKIESDENTSTTFPNNLIRYEKSILEETEDTCINCNEKLYLITYNREKHLICLNCGLDLNIKDQLYSLQDILDKNNSLWTEYSYNYFTYDELNQFRINKKSLLEHIPKQDPSKHEYDTNFFIEKIKHLPSTLIKYEDNLPEMKSTKIKCANCNTEIYSIKHTDTNKEKEHLICLECGLDLVNTDENTYKLNNIYNKNSIFWKKYNKQELSPEQLEHIRKEIHQNDNKIPQIILNHNLDKYIPFISSMQTSDDECILCDSKMLSFTDKEDKKHIICKDCGLDFIINDEGEYYLNDYADKSGEFWFYYNNKEYTYDNWKNLVKQNQPNPNTKINPDIDLSKLPVNIIRNYIHLMDNLIDSHQNCIWCDNPLYYITKQTILTTEEHCICLNCGLDFKLDGLNYELYDNSKNSRVLGDLYKGKTYTLENWYKKSSKVKK
ncbi:MAG: hypothetical protein E7Z84_04200 [Methanosphaera stadtmanae]|nr:hypothetical protein [Methanosphaera stadtmanae]